jgi:Sec-independent protein secretion pathway component TatC
MSEKAKLNTVLVLQFLTFAGLAYAYYRLAPVIDQTETTLEKADQIATKVNSFL